MTIIGQHPDLNQCSPDVLRSNIDKSDVSRAIDSTLKFIERNGTETYDPFDLIGSPYGQAVTNNRNFLTFLGRIPLWGGMMYAPLWSRWIFQTKKRPTAGGVANLARLYTYLGGRENLLKAKHHIDWLLANATKEEGYMGWGFPYPWTHKTFVPAGTPMGHGTMTCGNTLLAYLEATGDESLVNPLRLLCRFFDLKLNKTIRSSSSTALSYTPMDQTQVINIQADIGSLLIRVGSLLKESAFCDLGVKLIQCVIETQNADGSWYYSTYDSIGKPSIIDNHHTGMVLSALVEVVEMPQGTDAMRAAVREALRKGTQFFIEKLFTKDGVPMWSTTNLYPIDVYNFAQSIISLLDIRRLKLNSISEPGERMLHAVVGQLLKLMFKKDGGFLYRRTRFSKQDLSSLRWADALTSFSLARYNREVLGGIP